MHIATLDTAPRRRRHIVLKAADGGEMHTVLEVGGALDAIRLAHSLLMAAAELASEASHGDEK